MRRGAERLRLFTAAGPLELELRAPELAVPGREMLLRLELAMAADPHLAARALGWPPLARMLTALPGTAHGRLLELAARGQLAIHGCYARPTPGGATKPAKLPSGPPPRPPPRPVPRQPGNRAMVSPLIDVVPP